MHHALGKLQEHTNDDHPLIVVSSRVQTWGLCIMDSLLEFENTCILDHSATMTGSFKELKSQQKICAWGCYISHRGFSLFCHVKMKFIFGVTLCSSFLRFPSQFINQKIERSLEFINENCNFLCSLALVKISQQKIIHFFALFFLLKVFFIVWLAQQCFTTFKSLRCIYFYKLVVVVLLHQILS